MRRHLFIIVLQFVCGHMFAQKTIHGTVISTASGEAVAGATVQLMDSSRSVACDANGKFIIETNAQSSLVISATGYLTKTSTSSKDHVTVDEIDEPSC